MSTHHADAHTDSDTGTGRHPVNVAHLVMGLAFLCCAVAWALVQADAVSGSDVRWLLPIPWLVAGAAGLAALTVTNLRKHRPGPGPDTEHGSPFDTPLDTHDTTEIQEQP